VEEPVHMQDQISTTDPDSTYATKGGTPARLGYYDNYLVDNDSCVIVGAQAAAARMSQETVAAQDTEMGSSCSGWRIGTSLRICEPATVSTERGVHPSLPSVSLTNQNTIAISALPASL
jgi:hypothetical protein